MKCSGKELSLTAAMCVCLFSFTSRPFHLSLMILDLIIGYNAKVEIDSYFDESDTVQQRGFFSFFFFLVSMTGTRWSD